MSNTRYKLVKCPYCGAEYRIPETVTYATCPYCGTTFKIENPEEKIEHYLFRMIIDKNNAYRLAKSFATQQIGVAEDLADNAEFRSAKIYYVPVYIYEVKILAPCKEELEELEKEKESSIELGVHGGEEVNYVLVVANDNLPIPLPENYSFPARARMYFKPSILKNGVYLQPLLDPYEVFEEVKQPSLKQAVEEAEMACSNGYEVIDESQYLGIAHYPFWHIKYSYKGKEYQALVDAADGTIVYLEYPYSLKGRLIGFTGGLGALIGAGLIGGVIADKIAGLFTAGFIGGALTASPGLVYTLINLARFKGVYRYKPEEEAIFLPVR